MKNFGRFKADILKGLENNSAEHIKTIKNKYGKETSIYNVTMPLGINKQVLVVTGWKYEDKSNIPELVTAIPTGYKKEDK